MVSSVQSQPSAAHGTGYPNLHPGLFGHALRRTAAVARLWWQRHVQRQQLLRLDEHLLRDIGLNRGDAELEAAKGFWER